MPLTLDELETQIAERIAALDPTDHRQGASEVWTETDLPLTAVADSVLEAHLAYSVSVESAPVVDDGQLSEGFVSVLAAVSVIFLYRLRSDDQRRDTRQGAIRAAREVAKAVLDPSQFWGSALPVNIYEPQAMIAEFLPVRQNYNILVDVAL